MVVSTSISDFLKIPFLFPAFDFDQSGKFVVYSSNETGSPQLHLLSAQVGSLPKQLTKGEDPVFGGARISPKGNRIAFSQDKDGSENFHIYLMPIEGGEPQRITKNAYRMWGGFDWHPSGKEVTRTVASMKSCGLETTNVETEESIMLKEQTPPIGNVQYSHDGKWIACDAQVSAKSEQILVVNRNDPSDLIVYSVKEDSIDNSPSWSPDDKKLAFISDAKGTRQVVIQDFQGEERFFLKLHENEEIMPYRQAVWSPKGDRVYYILSRHSRTAVHGHPIYGERDAALPFPEGTVEFLRISRNERIVAMHSSMISPPGLYLHEIGSKTAVLFTPRKYDFELARLVKPKAVWFKSFDGRRIHGWYLAAVSGRAPYPAVVCVHGGPWAQVFDDWLHGDLLHSLSQSGFAVLAPNYRGSTGYGAAFEKLDIGDVGGGDLEDVVFGAEWLRKQKGIDASKIAVVGHSYGGYMALIALTKKPEVFAAGVGMSPVTDWLESYQLEDAAFRIGDEMLWGGPILEKSELLKERSPMTYVSKIRAPVMIMAGKEDARCPIQPVEKFVQRLKEMNHPYEFILEEKAGHVSSLFKWEEKIPIFKSIINYLKKVLV